MLNSVISVKSNRDVIEHVECNETSSFVALATWRYEACANGAINQYPLPKHLANIILLGVAIAKQVILDVLGAYIKSDLVPIS